MAIGSWSFLFFGVAAVLGFRACRSAGQRQLCLLAFNISFLGSFLGSVSSVAVLFLFLTLSYGAARSRWHCQANKKGGARWPAAATVGVILSLWFFLFCVREHSVFGSLNPFRGSAVSVVGVSYMVFRATSYFVDFELLERKDPLSYLNYVLFFPSLLSGPIARHEEFTLSVEKPLPLGPEDYLAALHRLLNGLLKKFVLADSLIVLLPNSENLTHTSTPMLWFGSLLSLVVLYFDFSGYCDIVISLARLMGCDLPENFDRPFLARNVQEFWNRWHMSLSFVVRDYFFMPMAKWGYRAFPKLSRILVITAVLAFCMMLIALWHGTTQGFVLYGTLHASALIALQLERYFRSKKAVVSFRPAEPSQHSAGDWLARAATYSFVSVAITLSVYSGGGLWYLVKRLSGQ